GEPIPHYFPAIVSEAQWLLARRAVDSRKTACGPRGEHVRNLFTGIIKDARDAWPMRIHTAAKGRGKPSLVSSGAMHRENDTPYTSFPYDRFEDYFLSLMEDELFTDLVQDRKNGAQAKIAALTGQLIELDAGLRDAQKRYRTAQNRETILDLIEQLEGEKK